MRCASCKANFSHSERELEFCRRLELPPTGQCFDCGQKQRLSFRNERALYRRKCDGSGAQILSIYAPDSPFTVYSSDYWYSDKWDACAYGQEFDFNRPFFEQFRELQLKVPRLSLSNFQNENSDYCNMSVRNRDSYLIFGCDGNEDLMYSTLSMKNRSCLDLDHSYENELCYYLSDCNNCYNCLFAHDSRNCTDCAFVSDCVGCNNCLLCTNLFNQSYRIRNQPVTKEEYQTVKQQLLNGSRAQWQALVAEFDALRCKRTVKYAHVLASEGCQGEYIKNSKDCINAFEISECRDIENVIYARRATDCISSGLIGYNTELVYNLQSCIDTFNCHLCYLVANARDLLYCDLAFNCSDLFGCAAIQNKKYCILNKQYSAADYKALRPKVIEHMKGGGEWGQFFPKSLSCFAYNETSAFDYYPLRESQAVQQGFRWRNSDEHVSPQATNLPPDRIQDVDVQLLSTPLTCSCGKSFKIQTRELDFYRKQQIPLPVNCPNCRHQDRKARRTPLSLYARRCQSCDAELMSSYAPARSESVLCEGCYEREVVAG